MVAAADVARDKSILDARVYPAGSTVELRLLNDGKVQVLIRKKSEPKR